MPEMNLKRNTAAYLLFGTSLLLTIAIGLLIQSVNLFVGLAFTELILILLPAVFFAKRVRQPIAEALRWKPLDLSTTLLSFFVGVGLWGIVATIDRVTKKLAGISNPMEAGDVTFGGWMLVLLLFAVLPAICEESLFRGAIQGTLRRSGSRKAILLTALLFAVFHLNPVPLLPLFILGCVFGLMCWRTNSTLSSMWAHFGNNALAVSVPMLASAEWQIWIMSGCVGVALVAGVLFWKRTARVTVETPVLATMDASVSVRSLVLTTVFGIGGFLLWLTTIIVAAIYLILPLNMPDASLEPDIGDNDRLIILRNDYFHQSLRPNDFIAVEIDGTTTMKRFLKMDDDKVLVSDNATEITIDPSQVRGKLIHNFRRPAHEQ